MVSKPAPMRSTNANANWQTISADRTHMTPLPAVPVTRSRKGVNSSCRAQLASPPDKRVTSAFACPIMALGSGTSCSTLLKKRKTRSRCAVLAVSGEEGETSVSFDQCIIAAGSEPVALRLKQPPLLGEVEDLTVIHHGHAAVLVENRLLAVYQAAAVRPDRRSPNPSQGHFCFGLCYGPFGCRHQLYPQREGKGIPGGP